MSSNTETLGLRLSRTIRKQDGDKERQRLAKIEAERVQKEAEERRIRVFLTSFREELTKQIMGGHRPRGKKLPDNFVINAGRIGIIRIDQESHAYNFIFKTFENWLKENDLRHNIEIQYDVRGENSWYEILVSPKEGIE